MPDAYLIAGAGGMLGTALRRVLAERGIRFVAPSESAFDITSGADVAAQVGAFASCLSSGERGVFVNAAAYTNVERAEDEPEIAYRVNAEAPGILARAARDVRLAFVHVSTDFVFDGTKFGPYVETDEPHSLSVYGASKLDGEKAVLEADPRAIIIRTAWAFGPNGVNFPVKVLAAARERGELTVVDDEIGSPTYTVDLAEGIVSLVSRGAAPGIYHLAGSGTVSRYDMAVRILSLAGIDVPIMRAHSADFPTKAARPRNSTLDCSKAAALGVVMPSWRDALRRFLADIGELSA